MDDKTYTMLKTARGSRDGLTVDTFQKGQSYALSPELAEQFYHQGAVEEVTEQATETPTARTRATKVTGPAETKVVAPAEAKGGEADIDPDTQRVEELVAVARDAYGLDVDSTMSEETLRELIEQAGEGQEDDSEETDGKSRKKKRK